MAGLEQPHQRLRMLWRCTGADQLADTVEERDTAGLRHRGMEMATRHATTHQPLEPMDSDELHAGVHSAVHIGQEPVHPTPVRLPPISHWSRYTHRMAEDDGGRGIALSGAVYRAGEGR